MQFTSDGADWCQVTAAEDFHLGDIVFVRNGRAVMADDWTGASGVLWRVIQPAKAGGDVYLITLKKKA